MPLAQYMFMAFHTVLVGVLEWEASASMRKHRRWEHVTNFNYYNGLSPTCFFINNIDAALPVRLERAASSYVLSDCYRALYDKKNRKKLVVSWS